VFQVISILLEREKIMKLGEKMIFVAGHKVTTDPWAVPLSRGRNLICIHSKKHIKNPPEDFPKKQQQNMESMAVRYLPCCLLSSSFFF
jgi:glycerol-3-phosphate O-acyltransferase